MLSLLSEAEPSLGFLAGRLEGRLPPQKAACVFNLAEPEPPWPLCPCLCSFGSGGGGLSGIQNAVRDEYPVPVPWPTLSQPPCYRKPVRHTL